MHNPTVQGIVSVLWPVVVGITALLLVAWLGERIALRTRVGTNHESQALPNPAKRSRVWYLIEQIVGVGGLLTYFLAPRPFALAVVAAATAYCIGLGYVRRIRPLRERGATDLEVAALVSLLILSFGSFGWLLVSSAGRLHGAV